MKKVSTSARASAKKAPKAPAPIRALTYEETRLFHGGSEGGGGGGTCA